MKTSSTASKTHPKRRTLLAVMRECGPCFENDDILVVEHKIVSKSEARE